MCGECRLEGDWKADADVAEGGSGAMCDVSSRANEAWWVYWSGAVGWLCKAYGAVLAGSCCIGAWWYPARGA